MKLYTQKNERGNVLFIILIVIVLSGALTVAIQSTSQTGNENIDSETSMIRLAEVKQYVAELENAVRFIMSDEASEVDIRFAHPDHSSDYGTITTNTAYQVFHRDGGGATFQDPPSGINNGDAWEFYGGTHLPDVGSSDAELIAVLPNITQSFCDLVNEKNGYDTATQPLDPGTCINEGATGRFDAGTQFSSSPNTTTEATFTVKPALQGCVQCSSDSSYHFFHVLMSR